MFTPLAHLAGNCGQRGRVEQPFGELGVQLIFCLDVGPIKRAQPLGTVEPRGDEAAESGPAGFQLRRQAVKFGAYDLSFRMLCFKRDKLLLFFRGKPLLRSFSQPGKEASFFVFRVKNAVRIQEMQAVPDSGEGRIGVCLEVTGCLDESIETLLDPTVTGQQMFYREIEGGGGRSDLNHLLSR